MGVVDFYEAYTKLGNPIIDAVVKVVKQSPFKAAGGLKPPIPHEMFTPLGGHSAAAYAADKARKLKSVVHDIESQFRVPIKDIASHRWGEDHPEHKTIESYVATLSDRDKRFIKGGMPSRDSLKELHESSKATVWAKYHRGTKFQKDIDKAKEDGRVAYIEELPMDTLEKRKTEAQIMPPAPPPQPQAQPDPSAQDPSQQTQQSQGGSADDSSNNPDNLDNPDNPDSDPITSGITDPGARSILQAMYQDFLGSFPSKESAAFANLKGAYVWAEDQNFQIATQKLGRDGAGKLEKLMTAVQAEGYGGDTADMYYMRWAVLAARNQSGKNKPKDQPDKGDGGSEPTAVPSRASMGNDGPVMESVPPFRPKNDKDLHNYSRHLLDWAMDIGRVISNPAYARKQGWSKPLTTEQISKLEKRCQELRNEERNLWSESFPSLTTSRKDDLAQIRSLLSKIEGEDPASDQVKLEQAVSVAEKLKLNDLAETLKKALEMSQYQFVMFDDVRANVRQAQEIISGIRESLVENTGIRIPRVVVKSSNVDRFHEAMIDIVESENSGKKDAASFTYEQAQGLLGDVTEEILLYFVPIGIKAADIQQMQSQNLDAVSFPVPVVVGLSMCENVARVAAGDDGVYFARSFDKEQIAGGYGLSVGFRAPQFEYEKEILVIADEIDGPDDSRMIFELDEAQFVGQPQDTQSSEGQEQNDGQQNDADQQGQNGAAPPPAPGQPRRMESAAPKDGKSAGKKAPDVRGAGQAAVQGQGGQAAAPVDNQGQPGDAAVGGGNGQPGPGVAGSGPSQSQGGGIQSGIAPQGGNFQVEPTDYGQTAVVPPSGGSQEWLKVLRQSQPGQQMGQNSAQRVQEAMDQNQKLQSAMSSTSQSKGQAKPGKKASAKSA